jgi:hypothetical protein
LEGHKVRHPHRLPLHVYKKELAAALVALRGAVLVLQVELATQALEFLVGTCKGRNPRRPRHTAHVREQVVEQPLESPHSS